MERTKKVYGKTELAQKYGWSRRTLMRKIVNNEEFLDCLITNGYKKTQKTFTPQQLLIIFEYFGSPIMAN